MIQLRPDEPPPTSAACRQRRGLEQAESHVSHREQGEERQRPERAAGHTSRKRAPAKEAEERDGLSGAPLGPDQHGGTRQ